jgi:polyhydroxyalkanoate synthesis repressor PhaR
MAAAKAGAPGAEGATTKGQDERIVIKKYANRRLYNTGSSSYVTLEHLRDMVQKGVDLVVYDAKSGEDITRSVLAQIIFDEESRGQNLLPIQFLRQLIGFYGDQMQSFVPTYLEMSLNAFSQQQQRMREQFGVPGFAPAQGLGVFQEQVRQNMVMFDRAMKMFSPFAYAGAPGTETGEPAAGVGAEKAPPASADTISELKARMEEMQRQIQKLADTKS